MVQILTWTKFVPGPPGPAAEKRIFDNDVIYREILIMHRPILSVFMCRKLPEAVIKIPTRFRQASTITGDAPKRIVWHDILMEQ